MARSRVSTAEAHFDATIDELVDVSFRMVKNSRFVRRSKLQTVIVGAMGTGILAYGLFSISTDAQVWAKLTGALLVGSLWGSSRRPL